MPSDSGEKTARANVEGIGLGPHAGNAMPPPRAVVENRPGTCMVFDATGDWVATCRAWEVATFLADSLDTDAGLGACRAETEHTLPWEAVPVIAERCNVERRFPAPIRVGGKTLVSEVLCEVLPTGGTPDVPERTAEQNATMLADLLNARVRDNQELADAYDKGKQASKEAVEKWEKMYRFASMQLAAIGDIVGNVNGDPEVTAGMVRELVAARRSPNPSTPPTSVTPVDPDPAPTGPDDKTAATSHCATCVRCQAYRKMADDEVRRHDERAREFESIVERTIQHSEWEREHGEWVRQRYVADVAAKERGIATLNKKLRKVAPENEAAATAKRRLHELATKASGFGIDGSWGTIVALIETLVSPTAAEVVAAMAHVEEKHAVNAAVAARPDVDKTPPSVPIEDRGPENLPLTTERGAAETVNVHAQRPPDAKDRHAAVGLVTRDDGRFLCVWNRRYEGWAFPGGMVEKGETILEGLCREVAEETSLKVRTAELVFEGEHGLRPKNNERDGRASVVHVFRVTTTGEPRETEPGCPITWLTREEFLEQSPFREFYAAKVFVDAPSAATEAKDPIDPIDLDPGIRGVVAWLRSLGFDTTDSGDGVTKAELVADGDALDVPHVHISVEPTKLLAEASRLLQALIDRGLISDPGTIQASYDPADGIATLSLMGINDEMLAAAGLEAQADAFIKSVADGMAATVQKTWRKAVAAAADADRRKVAEALVHRLDHESDTPSERLTALLAETRREERDRLLFGQGWAVTRKVGEDPPFDGPREYLVDVTKRNSDDVWKWSTNADDAWRLGYRRAELYAQCAFDVADTEWLGEKTGGADV